MKHNLFLTGSKNRTKKRAVILLCILITIAAILVSTKSSFRGRAQNADVAQPHSPLPEHVAYEFLFRRQAFYKQKAEELERQGKNAKALRSVIKDEAKLTDEQVAGLDEVASSSLQEAKEIDDRAYKIINAAKSRYPGGKIPQGQKPPPLPDELVVMQQQRNAIFQRGQVRLQLALGTEEFQKLDGYVRAKIVNKAPTQ